MKFWKFTVVFALAIIAVVAAQTTQNSQNGAAAPPTRSATVNPLPQSSVLRILTPVAGQQLSANIVDVRFELVNPAADAGSPNFQIQLDGGDPITTSSTQYTFTGVAPGTHSVTVVLVDANGIPVNGGRAAVQFGVASQQLRPQGSSSFNSKMQVGTPALGDTAQAKPDVDGIPGSNSALPLISVIGFGVLIGGVATAMKTR